MNLARPTTAPYGFLALLILLAAAIPAVAGKEQSKSPGKSAGKPPAQGVSLKAMEAKFDFGPKPLQGSIEHSAAVAPVSTELRAGATFNQDLLPKKLDQEWYWIPSWRSGMWESTSSTLEEVEDLVTGGQFNPKSVTDDRALEFYGYQKDKNAGIWDFVGTPRYQIVDTAEWREVQLIEKAQPIYVSNKKITKMFRGKVFRVDPYNNTIISVEQSESVQTYEPLGYGMVRRVSSSKTFDEDGRPRMLRKTLTTFKQVSAFRPINSYEGQDMQLSFRDFLTRNGLKHLIGTAAKASPAPMRIPAGAPRRSGAAARGAAPRPKSSGFNPFTFHSHSDLFNKHR